MRVVDRPNLILNAEKELGIVAGLQDRVVQVYGGVVYMVSYLSLSSFASNTINSTISYSYRILFITSLSAFRTDLTVDRILASNIWMT